MGRGRPGPDVDAGPDGGDAIGGDDAPGGTAPVALRVARALAGPGAGRVSVAGALPEAVREALPGDVEPVEAGAVTDGAPAPHTALLVLDGAVDGPPLERRLGAACRRFPGRLLVWQRDPIGPGAPDGVRPVPVERFFAFGFRRAFAAVEGEVRHALHEYRLADYKQPPDWLNARYWANPERFAADPDDEAAAREAQSGTAPGAGSGSTDR